MTKGVEERHCLNAQTITETLVLTLYLKPILGLGTLTERLGKVGCGCHFFFWGRGVIPIQTFFHT